MQSGGAGSSGRGVGFVNLMGWAQRADHGEARAKPGVINEGAELEALPRGVGSEG
jgi:hypothetical protein